MGNGINLRRHATRMEPGTVRIPVKRKSSLNSPNVEIKVNVDGREVCRLSVNGSAYFDTTEGVHRVEIRVPAGIREESDIGFREGDRLVVITKLGRITHEVVRSRRG